MQRDWDWEGFGEKLSRQIREIAVAVARDGIAETRRGEDMADDTVERHRRDQIHGAVTDIIEDISGRKGIGDEWEQIDAETQWEIMHVWAGIIRKRLTAIAG